MTIATKIAVTAPSAIAADTAEPLIPPQIARLLGPPPLIFGESHADFEELWGYLIAEVRPKDFIEHNLVRDMADCMWEVRRYRLLLAETVRARLPRVAGAMVPKLAKLFKAHENASDSEWVEETVTLAALGHEVASGDLDHVLGQVKLSREQLSAAAFGQEIGRITELLDLQQQADARRSRCSKDITLRRLALGRRLDQACESLISAAGSEDSQ